MAENQVYLIKSGQNSFVEETEAIVGISGGKVGIGTTAPEADLHVTGSVKIGGDLAVDGTFTTINSSTISVDDKNIELGSTDSPTDITADGGGITVKGATDKTFNWIDASDAWTSSEHLHLAAGKRFAADGIRALGVNGLNIGDDAGNGIFVQDGGKVGIATTNPGYDLDVDGSGNFASLYVDGNAVLTGEGSIFGKWEDGAAQGEIFYTGGNVGVGTNNPEYLLHVVGNSVVDGNFVVNGTSGNFNVSDFNVSGDSIVLNYGGGALTSNRGGIIVKDSAFANKTFEYVEGSDYWNSNVGLNITNGGINVASVSAVDANGLTLGDDAGNGIFVEDGGQIGINTTSPGYNLHVNGSTHVGGEFSVGSEFKISAGGAVGGTAPASDGDIIKWDNANNKWVAGANVGGGGGGGVAEVPLATINSLPSGQSIYQIDFAETYNVEPRIATQLEIDGEGSIIPYVVSGVSTSGYHLIFAQDIPNNNYRIHTTFGGRDVHWETGAGASLYYNDGDVSIQRNFTIGGNLTVNGTTTAVNTETVEIEDHNLVIAANTGYNQLTAEYPGAGGAYAGILWGTGDAGAASPVSLTYQTNKGFAFEGGNVGIGTTNPTNELCVNDSDSAAIIQITSSDTSSARLYLGDQSRGFRGGLVYDNSNDSLAFWGHDASTQTAERMRIDSDGNVGIGTTSPDSPLTVVEAGNVAFKMLKSSYGNLFTIGEDGGSSAILSANLSGGGLIFKTTDSTTTNEAMRILSNGNVGIGTTNPLSKLEVLDTSGPIITLNRNNTTIATDDVLGSIEFYDADGGSSSAGVTSAIKSLATGSNGASVLTLSTSNSSGGARTALAEAVRIDNSGNVGIGTTNPSDTVHVNGDMLILDDVTTATTTLRVARPQSGHSKILFPYRTGTSGTEIFNDGNTGNLRIQNTNGNLVLSNDGNVGIGTTSPDRNLVIDAGANSSPVRLIARSTDESCAIQIRNSANTATLTQLGGNLDSYFTGGNVGIGTTNPDAGLHVSRDNPNNYTARLYNTATSGANGLLIRHPNNAADSNSTYFLTCQDSTAIRMRVFTDGDIQNHDGTYGQLSSDLRLKENIVDAPGKLKDLMSLEVKNYNFIGDNKKMIGFVAQDFEKVFPSLVTISDTREYDDDGNVTSGFEDARGMKVGMEFAILTKAIQEQQQIIEDLKSQNASLESRISALES